MCRDGIARQPGWVQTVVVKRLSFLAGLLVLLTGAIAGEQLTIDAASQLELQGKFKEAARQLNFALTNQSLNDSARFELAFELDRLERIRKDYPLTKEKLFARLKESVRDLTEKEFEGWIAEGWFDSREFDGERRFMVSSVSNLFFRHADLNSRRLPPKDTTKHDQASLETCRAIKAAARKEKHAVTGGEQESGFAR